MKCFLLKIRSYRQFVFCHKSSFSLGAQLNVSNNKLPVQMGIACIFWMDCIPSRSGKIWIIHWSLLFLLWLNAELNRLCLCCTSAAIARYSTCAPRCRPIWASTQIWWSGSVTRHGDRTSDGPEDLHPRFVRITIFVVNFNIPVNPVSNEVWMRNLFGLCGDDLKDGHALKLLVTGNSVSNIQ